MCLALAAFGASAVLLWANPAPARAASVGPQYGSIGQYGEVWRGGGFDACWYDNGRYDGAGASNGVAGCTSTASQPAPGKFIDPVGFAVDTEDTTPGGDGTAIYVLDRTSNLPGRLHSGRTSWRLQKLDDRDHVLGSSEFTLPLKASNASSSGVFNYEMMGLAVDPAQGAVYALVVGFCDNSDFSGCSPPFVASGSTEYVEEILAWSTAPTGGQLGRPAGLPADTLSAGANGFPTPSVLSTASQLSQGGTPEADGSPQIVGPEGLAVDATGGDQYLAVESGDATSNGAGTGITQVCASSSCAACPANPPSWVVCYDANPQQGDIRLQWSASALSGLDNDNFDEFDPPAGISTVLPDTSGATPGSLTALFDEGIGRGEASNIDVVNVPADLTDPPAILSSGADNLSGENDDASVATSDYDPENPSGDPEAEDGGPTAATDLASPQVVTLSNGLYASEFEPDPVGQSDSQDPDGQQGLWTANNPGVRLDQPLPDGTLSNLSSDPANPVNPPLTTLFDTLGNPSVNHSGSTSSADACNLSDSDSAANQVPSYPSLAAGANGTLWVLTRGSDSSGFGFQAGPGGAVEGGRYLIELTPQQGDACPTSSGTFTVTAPNGSPQPASTSSPLSVKVGSTVGFDACPQPTSTYPNCPPTGSMGINTLGAATAAYEWNFGDGTSDSVATVPGPDFDFLWPSPTETHEFQRAGNFAVTLTMFSDFGTYVESGTVDVTSGTLPVASFTDGTSGLTATFDASASTPSPGHQILAYQWNWGDGQIDDDPSPTDSHTYAAPGTYTVRLSVLDSAFAHSPTPATETVTVTAPPAPPPAAGAPAATPPAPPPPGPPAVIATVASRVVRHGRVSLVLSCPTGQTLCRGAVVLRTLNAVTVSLEKDGKRTRMQVLIVGRTSFRIRGGKTKTISIHLSRRAMALLAKYPLLWTTVTITATNPEGTRHVTKFRLAVQPAARPRKAKHGR